MQQTTNYNLNIVEGSDLVNPLTQQNPNFQTIDSAMHDNALASVGTATELKTGTVHALVRNGDNDNPVFKFTATADFVEGDTFTVDGAVVSAYLPNGTIVPGNAYKTNSDVLCILTGNHLTLCVSENITALKEQVQTNTNNISLHQSQVGNVGELETESKVVVGAVNELKEDLDDKGKWHLLWTNSDSSVSFQSQTINIDLSSYSRVVIKSKIRPNSDRYTLIEMPIDNTIYNIINGVYNEWQLSMRSCRAFTSGVFFDIGYAKSSFNSTATESANEIIPTNIYGIK